MKKRNLINTFGILIILLTVLNLNAKTDDKLWNRAVKIASKNQNFIPGSIYENEKVFNKNGKLEESTKTKYKIIKDRKAKYKFYLLSSAKDGKDNFKNKQKELNEIGDDKIWDNEEENPFLPSVQNYIKLKKTDETKRINGKIYLKYRYSQKTKNGLWKGIAWLNKKTGTPIKIVTTLQKEIKKKDYKLTFCRLTVNFKKGKNRTWYAISMFINMNITAKIMPFVTFKGKIKTIYSFDKFWKVK